MSRTVRRPAWIAVFGLLLGAPALAHDYSEQLHARLQGDDLDTAGRIDVVVTGGQLTSPEFRLTISPEGEGRSRVEIVDLQESLWAAGVGLDESPPANEYEAWERVRRTEFDVTTATCPALEPAIAAFVATLEARLVSFHAEPAGETLSQITSHAGLVEVRATDSSFVRVTLGSRSGGLDEFLVAADTITRAASACRKLPVRRLAPNAQED